ncbi:MAG: hypothetical protein IIA09_18225, partial [Proteobacteria bacterium]|nr:hypothetical protein [Pseudomonadota bacterium]
VMSGTAHARHFAPPSQAVEGPQNLIGLSRAELEAAVLPLQVDVPDLRADVELLPVELAIELYDTVGSEDKSLEIVPGAGHNDLLWVGRDQYFEAISDFLVSGDSHFYDEATVSLKPEEPAKATPPIFTSG